MPHAPLPPDEQRRLAILRDLGILQTPPEEAFDAIIRSAASVFQAPIAAINLVDAFEEWPKAALGVACSSSPRDSAFCSHAILRRDPTIVRDASRDPRFADSPQVTEKGIRFYAGCPIIVRQPVPGAERQFAIGALCVKDYKPRQPTHEQISVLEDLALLAGEVIESRSNLLRQFHLATAFDACSDAIIVKDADGTIRHFNPAAEQLYGVKSADALGRRGTDLFPFTDPELDQRFQAALLAGERLSTPARRRTPIGDIDVMLSTGPMRDAKGTPVGAVVIARPLPAAATEAPAPARTDPFEVPVPAARIHVAPSGECRVLEATPDLLRLLRLPEHAPPDPHAMLARVFEADRPRLLELARDSLRTLTPMHCELRLSLPGAVSCWVEVFARPTRGGAQHDAPGGITLHAVAIDTTAARESDLLRQRTTTELMRAKLQLESRLAQRHAA